MTLIADITASLTSAMKARDTRRVDTLRFLIANIKKMAIDTYGKDADTKLTDEDVLAVVKKSVKSHKESIAAYQTAQRADLVQKEQEEVAILSEYMPQMMSVEHIESVVKECIDTGASDFGQVMRLAMTKLRGQADGQQVAEVTKRLLASHS